MKKIVTYSLIAFTLVTSFSVLLLPVAAHAQLEQAVMATQLAAKAQAGGLGWVADLALTVPGYIASYVLLPLVGWITTLSGLLLNFVVNQTVVQMGSDFSDPNGLGGAINSIWGTVRDVGNMFFIFILLYVGIMTMFGKIDTKRYITNIVIAALLVNFSLFLTKVIIDAGNLLALSFYSPIVGAQLPGSTVFDHGISNVMMDQLHLATLWDHRGTLSGSQLVTIGIMGSIFALVAAFVFAAAAILFIIRYIVLIFVLILSPLMFLGLALPGTGGARKQWWDALIGQTFFAPIYFFMMWIVIKLTLTLYGTNSSGSLANSLSGTYQNGQFSGTPDSFSLMVHFVVMIGFLIMALIISKSYASRGGPAVSVLNKWGMNAMFGTAIGGTLRKTLGRAGNVAANNAGLIKAADEKKGFAGAASRLALYASKKTASGTFDMRNASVPTGAASDLVRGTLGRTKFGKKIGADEFDDISSINVGSRVADLAGAGQGGKKGFREQQAEDKKKWRDIRSKDAEEVKMANARSAINNGIKSGATPAEIEAMERSLNNLTDKQVETMVESNRKMLESQEFANKISVQQLEALNKSEKLSEEEKRLLKDNRFKIINDGIRTPPAAGTPAAAAFSGAIKGLRDEELEMVDPAHLKNPEFIAQLRPAQIEAINKSKKFTKSQKDDVRNLRREPLLQALDTAHAGYAPNPAVVRNTITKMSAKELKALMSQKISFTDPVTGAALTDQPLLVHPDVISLLKPNKLKQMALDDMSDADILTIRNAILSRLPATDPTVVWLNDMSKGGIEFNA